MGLTEYVVCMYIRLSSSDDDLKESVWKDESGSITAQRELINDYLSEHEEFIDCTVIEKCDDGFSGTDFNERPGYIEMMELAKAGKINCIIVKDFSRLGRDYIEVGTLMETVFPFLNIRFISVNDGYDSNSLKNGEVGGLDVSFKNLVYDYYARETSFKEKLAWKKSAERGEYRATVTLYGYKKSQADNKKIVIDEEAAGVVREIFSMKLAGMGCTEIARILNNRKIMTPLEYHKSKGLKVKKQTRKYYWSGSVVKKLIANERYAGNMVTLRTTGEHIRGSRKANLPENWIRVKNTHEAIVSYEDYLKANAGKRKISRMKTEFKNIYVCGRCGRLMSVCPSEKMQCRINRDTGNKICTVTSITVGRLEKLILYDIKKKFQLVLDESAISNIRTKTSREETEQELNHIRQTMASVSQEWKNIYNDYADRKISREEYIAQVSRYKNVKMEIEKKEKETARNLSEIRDSADKNKRLECIMEACIKEEFLTTVMKDALIDRVVVYDNDVFEIYWKFDLYDYLGKISRVDIGK